MTTATVKESPDCLEGECVICGTFTVNAHNHGGCNVCCGCHDQLGTDLLKPSSQAIDRLRIAQAAAASSK